MCKFLGDKNRVETFAYDWRDSIRTQADELARKISKELKSHKNPVRVLAHSMGGLVARALIAHHDGLWEEMIARGGRLVMLGTPNRGSYVILRLLFRVDRTLKLLSLLDIRNDRARLSQIIAGFRGVLEMLPEDPHENYFDSAWWKVWSGHAAQPDTGELKNALTPAPRSLTRSTQSTWFTSPDPDRRRRLVFAAGRMGRSSGLPILAATALCPTRLAHSRTRPVPKCRPTTSRPCTAI